MKVYKSYDLDNAKARSVSTELSPVTIGPDEAAVISLRPEEGANHQILVTGFSIYSPEFSHVKLVHGGEFSYNGSLLWTKATEGVEYCVHPGGSKLNGGTVKYSAYQPSGVGFRFDVENLILCRAFDEEDGLGNAINILVSSVAPSVCFAVINWRID